MNAHEREVESLRKRIAALKDQRAKLDPRIPKADALAAADALVDQLRSEADAKRVAAELCQADRVRGVPVIELAGKGGGRDVASFVAWLQPDLLRKRLREEVEQRYSDGVGMPAASRAKAQQEIDQQIFVLEVEEERAVINSERAGAPVNRRHDADPAAVLAA